MWEPSSLPAKIEELAEFPLGDRGFIVGGPVTCCGQLVLTTASRGEQASLHAAAEHDHCRPPLACLSTKVSVVVEVTGKLDKVPDLFSCERLKVHGANCTAERVGVFLS